MARQRSEWMGNGYNHVISFKFNRLISDLHLLELSLNDRKYTWTRSKTLTSLALLDRFLCSVEWDKHFSSSNLSSFTRIYSDHSPPLLMIGSVSNTRTYNFKFDRSWLGFLEKLE